MSNPNPPASPSGLAIFARKRLPVQIGERSIEVRELTVGEIARVHDELVRVVRGLAGAVPFSDESEAAIAVAAATTDVPAEHWREAGGGALYAVIRAAAVANMDFFVHRAEAASTLLAPTETPPSGAGSTSSTSSAPAAITTP